MRPAKFASRAKSSLVRMSAIVALVASGAAMLAAACQPSTAEAQKAAAPAVAADWLPTSSYGLTPSFNEEFDRLSLWNGESGIWTTTFGYDGIANRTLPTNGELQLYVERGFAGTGRTPLGLDPFELNHGILDIVATRVSDVQARRMWDYRYASGLLTTRNAHAQTYGYFEISAKLPEGRGLWSAFWLLPEGGGWPPEIDVMEHLGRETDRVYVGFHANPNGERDGGTVPSEMADTTDGFHRYGVLWEPEHLTWFIDGVQVHQVPTPDDMHQPMYMLVNLAIGGNWAQTPDPFTQFPARMQVDYVRAWALERQPAGL